MTIFARFERKIIVLLAVVLLAPMPFAFQGIVHAAVPSVWIQNAADRAFQSSTLPAKPITSIDLYSAKNEYEAAQILVRSPSAQTNLFVTANPLTGPGGATIPVTNIQVRTEYTHVNVTKMSGDSQNPPDGSANYTDALIDQTPKSLSANVTQPYWYNVYVPANQTPGTYAGTVTVTSSLGTVNVPVTVEVYNVTIPPTNQSTFKMLNWFGSAGWDYDSVEKAIPLQYSTPSTPVVMYDANWWKVIGNFAKNHAKHRNNVIFTDTTALLIPNTSINAANTSYNFVWTTFDKFVQTFIDAGAMQYIYNLPILSRVNNVSKLKILKNVNGVTKMVEVDVNTPEANAYLDIFFPALKAHLDAKGWTNLFYMSAIDEPNNQAQVDAANWLYGKFKAYFPNGKTSEAHHLLTGGYENSLSTFVPVIDVYEKYSGYYQNRRISGKDLWLYNCILPRDDYMNRFLSYHLDKTRLVPWLVWKIGGNGYLHWGWNYWAENVNGQWIATDTFQGGYVGAGDQWLVRPNKAAYDVYDSVRSEAQLDGLEDYELLQILSQTKPLVAKSIASTLITNSAVYTRKGNLVVNRHKQLLDEIVSSRNDSRYPFSDAFGGSEGNWVHTVGNWFVAGGEYSQSDMSSYNTVSAIKGRTYGDFALTFDTKIVNDNGNHANWAGAMIRNLNATDLETGYLVAIRNNGEIHLWRTGSVLAAAMVPGYVAGQYTTIKVVAQGSNIKVFAGNNPNALINYNDAGFSSGMIGLITGGASAKFDNVVVNAEQNYAEGKTVSYLSNYTGDGWAPHHLADGKINSSTASLGYTSNSQINVQNHNEWVKIDFGKSYDLERVDLYPRNDGVNTGYGFPIDFTIETSQDNVNWTTVVTRTGYALPGNAVQSFAFPSVSARYLKVNATKLQLEGPTAGTYRLHFAEIQAFGGNLGLGKSVTASSSYENSNEGWAIANATDGSRLSNGFYSMGWTSDSNKTVNHSEWVKIDLGGNSRISEVTLFPNNEENSLGDFFPIDFAIETSTDNANWTTAASMTGYASPANEGQIFSFAERNARYVRITGTNLRFEPNEGTYRMGFAEIEVK